ncbi:MAG: hypothetical protein U9R07_06995 [Pseudomonadota bacterium]|nr:hypothetical protein [Pseudomonadota bacterium]
MTGLLFALLATLLVGVGARDQVLVAQLAARQGARPSLLLVAIASGMAAAGLAAWGGAQVAGLMAGNARLFLVALALGLAGLELIVLRPRAAPAEPTHSLGAFAIVIFAMQLTDAARFVVFALAAMTRAPLATGLGGAVGAALVVAAGWMLFGQAASLGRLRRGLGVGLLLLAVGLGLRATGAV